MAERLTIEIPPDLDGERVDRALAVMLGISRGKARALVDEGVTIDDDPAKPSDRVAVGSKLVTPPPETAAVLEPEDVSFDILHEDPCLVVVDKPAGLVVHPGSGRKRGTLAAGLLYRFPEIEGVGQADRWGLVHRLDRDTSGALLVARTAGCHSALSEMIRRREVTRTYTVLANGVFGAPTGSIEAPIGRDPIRPTRRAVIQTGKDARTHYEVDETFEHADCSLLTVRLETGRTHQIRVHLAAIDHHVVGDRTYGRGVTKATSPRIFLHARSLEFRHPESGVAISVEAPLPPDLSEVLTDLRLESTG